LNLTVAHEEEKEVPLDVVKAAVDDFCLRLDLSARSRSRLFALPRAAQCYAMQNFRSSDEEKSSAFEAYLRELQRQTPAPWGDGACTLRIEATGAIIGRCCPDLDALCRDDPPERLAHMHCKVMSEDDRFYVCDLDSSSEGTLLDGFALNDQWVGPLKSGSMLTVGPLRIKIQLSDMAKDTLPKAGGPLKRTSADDDDGVWQRKVFQKTEEDEKEAERRRQEQYKDRAEERRKRSSFEAGSAAIDGLIGRFEQIREAEKRAEEEEENRVERPVQEAQREANLGLDGSFIGWGQGGVERAGLGYNSGARSLLIPDVVDPKSLSRSDSSLMKTQLRYKQASEKR